MFCVYLTTYSGNKMPMFYIGSSSVEKINQGYRGSILSKEYSEVFKNELKHNEHLFSTRIVYKCKSRKEALEKELYFQKCLNVVQSPLYINKSFASSNGFFGMDVKKENHPNFGKRGSEVGWFGIKRSDVSKENYSKSKSGKNNPMIAHYKLFNKNNELVFESFGDIKNKLIDLGISSYVTNMLIKNMGMPLTFIKVGKSGPSPKIVPEYLGWRLEKNQKHKNVGSTGMKWINDRGYRISIN